MLLVGQNYQNGHLDISLGARSDLYLSLFSFIKGKWDQKLFHLRFSSDLEITSCCFVVLFDSPYSVKGPNYKLCTLLSSNFPPF